MSYKKIEKLKDYVLSVFLDGAQVKPYAKFARIKARQGVVGEAVETKMANGLSETKNIVGIDEKTNQPDWIVTNPSGEEYLVKDSNFQKKYEVFDKENGIYKPKGGVQMFIQIPEDISFTAPWGEEMNVSAGGYLNITNPKDIYGVQEKEFHETYAECDIHGKFIDESLNNISFDNDELTM